MVIFMLGVKRNLKTPLVGQITLIAKGHKSLAINLEMTLVKLNMMSLM
jgi:hypothetical protein